MRSYLSLFTETNQYYTDEGNSITQSDYCRGQTLFAFDLTPDLGLRPLFGIWIRVKTLVRIGWQSTLICADVVTISTAMVCHLCTKSLKTF